MPQTTTLLQLRTQARQRADQENTTFVADSELTTMVNYELGDLYDILVNAYEDYFVTVDTSTTLVSGTETYALPSDFYKLLALFHKDTSGATERHHIPRMRIQELVRYSNDYAPTSYGRAGFAYGLQGANVRIAPATGASGILELHYIPEITKLSADGDALTFNVPTQGWDQYIVAGAAARMMIKEESDPTPLLMEQARIKDNIIHSAKDRDSAEPHRVFDVYRRISPQFYHL